MNKSGRLQILALAIAFVEAVTGLVLSLLDITPFTGFWGAINLVTLTWAGLLLYGEALERRGK